MSNIMGYCRRSSRLLFYGYNSCKSPNQESVSRTRLHSFSSRRNFGEFFGLKQQQRKSPFVDGPNNLVPSRGWRRAVWNLENAAALVYFGIGVAFVVYFGKWETVPYTKRKHLVVMRTSPLSEEEIGKKKFEASKKMFKEKVVPPLHPDSVRARKIVHDLIEAVRRESTDDDRSKKRVEGWEVACIDFPANLTLFFAGGNFIIFNGLLHNWGEGEDAQIAASIAPKLARVVARHDTEKLTMVELIPSTLLLILHFFLNPATINSMPSLLKYLRFPFARSVVYVITWKALRRLLNKIYTLKMDVEADHIGLLLLASAGYDPRVALQVREEAVRLKGDSRWEKMRTQLLALQMDEALSIYREVHASTMNSLSDQ